MPSEGILSVTKVPQFMGKVNPKTATEVVETLDNEQPAAEESNQEVETTEAPVEETPAEDPETAG